MVEDKEVNKVMSFVKEELDYYLSVPWGAILCVGKQHCVALLTDSPEQPREGSGCLGAVSVLWAAHIFKHKLRASRSLINIYA